ncbi:AAA family ATPase [Amycolatopsis sp. FDAARGOS 1241]|uniref:AAA family ATPase n=1 Tax=Amycolatopsis sp. FDAARGOS 1241 TaxID=2778070 RepID=UPI001951765E|nr:AAA family ATPase [Amycolatopsis sp. FDAARGOS 1241]QRP43642.1 AAA family ATPase [Amycolatopsis sp. FDAARGOS 1241]
MKIHYVHLRNFRGVTDRRVDFAESGVTVVEGVNEAGKSSMIEAIDLLLKHPDGSKSSQVLAVRPRSVDAAPEVEAEITAGKYRFVFGKRWCKHPRTTLRMIEPAPADLVGREAHDRVQEMVKETLDDGLWAALRVAQNEPISQSALGGNDALMRALDAAAGGARETGRESSLFERVEREYLKYYTPGGKAKAELKAAAEQREEAKRVAAAEEESLREVERDVERHAELTRELTSLSAELVEQKEELAEWVGRKSALDERRALVETLSSRLAVVSAETDAAEVAVATRHELVAAIAAQEHSAAEILEEAAQAQVTADAAQALARDAELTLNAATQAAERAESEERRAAEHVRYLHDKAELDDLTRRASRAEEAIEQRNAAEAFLAICTLDEPGFAALEAAYAASREALAVLEAGAPTLELEALARLEVSLNGEPATFEVGDVRSEPVTDTLELVFPEQALLRIGLGNGQDLKLAADEAEADFRRCCADAAVEGIAEARNVIAKRRAVESDRLTAQQALKLALDDRLLDDIRSDRVRLSARINSYTTSDERPGDLATAVATELDARKQTESARRKASDAATRHQDLLAAGTEANNNAIALRTQSGSAQEQLLLMRDRLATARADAPDDSLTERLTNCEDTRSAARLALAAAEADLASQDPETVEARLTATQAWGERLEEDHRSRTSDLTKLQGRLELAGTEGRQDRFDRAQAAWSEAERRYDSAHRRSSAASCLFTTLRTARETAKQTYVQPFRDQLERLGRIVFGPTLKLGIDSDLRIANRTLENITVGYDDLSTGTREQLCIITRLACAAMIDPADGAPVIIDDALGHTDPERLARMGAVFTAANTQSQVIVLTCTPERYRRVGNAKVVPVRPCRSTAVEAPSGHALPDGPEDAILACLDRATGPLGKADLIRLSGIDETQWTPTIRALVDQEKIVKTGDRRGTLYHPKWQAPGAELAS